jgi:hypothetical protein
MSHSISSRTGEVRYPSAAIILWFLIGKKPGFFCNLRKSHTNLNLYNKVTRSTFFALVSGQLLNICVILKYSNRRQESFHVGGKI